MLLTDLDLNSSTSTRYMDYIPVWPMVHASVASMGVVVSSMSFPYRQSPASSLRLSLAPRPAIRTSVSLESSKLSAMKTTLSTGIEIWKIWQKTLNVCTAGSPIYGKKLLPVFFVTSSLDSWLGLLPTQMISRAFPWHNHGSSWSLPQPHLHQCSHTWWHDNSQFQRL